MRSLAILVLLAAFSVVGCGREPWMGKPSPEREGVQWSHKELIEYLHVKGVPFTTDVPNSKFSGPGWLVGMKDGQLTDDVVSVTLWPTAQEAKDRAGLSEKAFSWGRFIFFEDNTPGQPGGLKKSIQDALQ